MISAVRRIRALRPILAALLLASALLVVDSAGVSAARSATDVAPTGTLTPTATPAPTAEATLTATATPPPTATATPRPRPTALPTPKPSRDRKNHGVHRRTATATPTATAIASATAKPSPTPHARHAVSPRRATHHRKKRPTPTPSPTVTPTPTPALNLTTENSISPVMCNGPRRPPAVHPFLSPPYRGWTSIVSFIDHDLPDFSQDGLVITSNGMEARPDALHHATDFPAYWNSDLRQYLYYDGHNGYDYDLYYQPVYAAAAGKVIYAALEYSYAPHSGYGNMIMINHGHGYVTLYGHFSKILVKKGERVKRGQEIGISGNTGHSSGPHLHFTVFHNCTPTDPYGWTGQGEDPLSGYQGEHSEYLWLRAPLVTNPLPGWPGISSMSGPELPRLVLLRLPSTRGGTAAFTRALQAEAAAVQRALQAEGGVTSFDPLRGAVRLLGPVAPERVYALHDVASIGSTDVAEDARSDVLHALAQAALATGHKEVRLDGSHRWTGYLLQWDGQTFLVGHGEKGTVARLQLPLSKSKRVVRHVEADPSNGAYAVDLGAMSRHQMTALFSNLRRENTHRAPARVEPRPRLPRRPHVAVRKRAATSDASGPFLALALLAAVVAAAVLGASRRRRAFAGSSSTVGEDAGGNGEAH